MTRSPILIFTVVLLVGFAVTAKGRHPAERVAKDIERVTRTLGR